MTRLVKLGMVISLSLSHLVAQGGVQWLRVEALNGNGMAGHLGVAAASTFPSSTFLQQVLYIHMHLLRVAIKLGASEYLCRPRLLSDSLVAAFSSAVHLRCHRPFDNRPLIHIAVCLYILSF